MSSFRPFFIGCRFYNNDHSSNAQAWLCLGFFYVQRSSPKYFLSHLWLISRRFCKSPFMTFMRCLSAGGAVPMVMTDRKLRFNGNVRPRVPIRNVWLEGCSEKIRITEQTQASAEISGFGWTARTIGKARLVTRRSQLRTGEKAPGSTNTCADNVARNSGAYLRAWMPSQRA